MKLDEYQDAAANHRQGPSLVAGSPGGGKTRVVMERVRRLVQAGIRPEHILLVTFTRAACGEMQQRLGKMGISGCEVRTIHSLCFDRAPKMAPWLFNGLRFDESNAIPVIITGAARALQKQDLISGCGVDRKVLETFVSRVKNLGPAFWHKDWFHFNGNAEQLVKRVAADWLEEHSDFDADDGWLIYQQAEQGRWEAGLYGYDDCQNWCWSLLISNPALLSWWQSQWSVVIVDEAQDCSSIQHDLARLSVGLPSRVFKTVGASDRDHNLMLAGDVSQCLDPDSTWLTHVDGSGKTMPVSLRNITPGDHVMAPRGGAPVGQRIIKKGIASKTLIAEIRTSSGRTLRGSCDHLVFACMPRPSQRVFTYLMWRSDKGFRLGITRGPKNKRLHSVMVRALHEGADRMWLLDAYDTLAEAALHESLMSLRYRVPTCPFVDHGRGMRVSQQELDVIFKEFGHVGGHQILADKGLRFEWPSFLPQNQIGKRITVGLIVGRGAVSPCEVLCESASIDRQDVEDELKLFGITLKGGSKGTRRFRKVYQDATKAHEDIVLVAKAIEKATGIPTSIRMTLSNAHGPHKSRMTATTLSALVPGCHVWTDEEKSEEIVSLRRIRQQAELMDIEVEEATSYFANGIAVHNSLYAFRTAEPGAILQFSNELETQVYRLPKNYRSTDIICALGTNVVRGRPWHLAGDIEPTRGIGGSEVEFCTFGSRNDEVIWIVRKAQELGLGQTVVLARTAAVLHWISIQCAKEQIPYVKLCGGFILDSREAQDLLSYLKVICGRDEHFEASERALRAFNKFVGHKQFAAARESNMPTLAERILDKAKLIPPQRRTVRLFKEVLDSLALMAKQGRRPSEMLQWVINEIGYEQRLAEDMGLTTAEGDSGAFIVLEELIEFAQDFESCEALLDQVDQLRALNQATRGAQASAIANGIPKDVLTLSTVHGFKGLQSQHVVIADVSHGRFPSAKSMLDPEAAQEETRILYVAVTRAQDRLFVTRTRPPGDPDSSFWAFLQRQVAAIREAGSKVCPLAEVPNLVEPASA